MPNGEPAYTVIMIEKEERTLLKGLAYMKMSAAEYIKSLPITYQQWIDPAVLPNELPAQFQDPANKGKIGKQKQRANLLNAMSQEKVFHEPKPYQFFDAMRITGTPYNLMMIRAFAWMALGFD